MAGNLCVAIDALTLVAGGSVTYLTNLLPSFAEVDNQNEYFVIVREEEARIPIEELGGRFHRINCRIKPGLVARERFRQLRIPRMLEHVGADLLYSPNDVTCFTTSRPVVLAVRNFAPFYASGRILKERARWSILRFVMWASARKASRVIFVSNYSRNVILENLSIPQSNTHVIYHGINQARFAEPDLDAVPPEFNKYLYYAKPYVLSVGTINPHKNYDTLIRAWSLFHARHREYHLLIIGRPSHQRYVSQLHALVRDIGLSDVVTFFGEVPYQHIHAAYHHASVMVLPSLLETFGHPLAEAMAAKVPLVASDASSIPEIVGDAALLVDPRDPSAFANSIAQVIEDESLRTRLIESGKLRVQVFSWDIAASKTLNVFEEVFA